MIQILITFIPSLCWILYRCYQILRTPVEEIIQDLSIEIPHRPNVYIDSINETSVVLHWDIDRIVGENLYYVIVINGQEVATITSTSCKLNSLEPKQLYQIEVIAINSITNFKSQSKLVLIQTFDKEDPKFSFANDEEMLNQDSFEETFTKNIIASTNIDTSNITDSKDFDHATNEIVENLTVEKIQNISDPDILNDYLRILQNEVIKINLEYKNHQASLTKELDSLQIEYKLHKQEYDEETDNKAKKDSNVKSLEKSKDKLTFQKSKLINQKNALSSSIELLHKKLDEYQVKVKKLTERNTIHLKNEKNDIKKIQQEISKTEESIKNVKVENDLLEEHSKTLQIEKKELSVLLSQIKPLVDIINSPLPNEDSVGHPPSINYHSANNSVTNLVAQSNPSSSSPSPAPVQAALANNATLFNKDGSINKVILDTLVKLFEIVPSWEDEIMREIHTCQTLENNWKESFQLAIKKYVSMHQSLQIAKQNKDKQYQPVKLTEYQASIDFGGFANALPKVKYGTLSKRNFSPSSEDNYAQAFSNKNIVNSVNNVKSTVNVDGGNTNNNNNNFTPVNANTTNNLTNFYSHYSQVYTPEADVIDNSIDQISDLEHPQPLQQYQSIDQYQLQSSLVNQQQQSQVLQSQPLYDQMNLEQYRSAFEPILEPVSSAYQSPPTLQVDTHQYFGPTATSANQFDNSSYALLQGQQNTHITPGLTQSQSLGFPYDDSIYTTEIQSPNGDAQSFNLAYNSQNLSTSAIGGGTSSLYNYTSPIMARPTLTGTPISTTASLATGTGNSNMWSANNLSMFGNNPSSTTDKLTTPSINSTNDFVFNNAGGDSTHSAGATSASSFFMTPTSSSSKSIWTDDPNELTSSTSTVIASTTGGLQPSQSHHTRTVSSNSQIWRNDTGASNTNHLFNLGGVFGNSNLSLHLPPNLSTPQSSGTNGLYGNVAGTTNSGSTNISSGSNGTTSFPTTFGQPLQSRNDEKDSST